MSAAGGGAFAVAARGRVEVADTDAGGVVYYGRYPRLLDRGILAWRRERGIPGLGPPGHLFMVGSLEIEYRTPARFDDEIEVAVRAAEVSRASHLMEARIERIDPGPREVVATARLRIVGVGDYGGRPSRLPADLRARLLGDAAGEGAP